MRDPDLAPDPDLALAPDPDRDLAPDLVHDLARGGTLYFSTHARELELDHRLEDQATLVDTTPDDFRRQPHRTWRFKK